MEKEDLAEPKDPIDRTLIEVALPTTVACERMTTIVLTVVVSRQRLWTMVQYFADGQQWWYTDGPL